MTSFEKKILLFYSKELFQEICLYTTLVCYFESKSENQSVSTQVESVKQ